MWVVKLGGSLLDTSELEAWLDIVSRYGDGKVVIVPGGGIFADAVRHAQQQTGVSDKVAHHMAVLAMDQYGVLMAGLNAKVVTAASELEIAERGWQHRGIVWLPSKMVCAEESIPASWDITSDSLAAWLAKTLNAEHLILVKSARPLEGQNSIEKLTSEGIVDPRFGDFIHRQNFKTWVLGKEDYVFFEGGISRDRLYLTGMQINSPLNTGAGDEQASHRAHL